MLLSVPPKSEDWETPKEWLASGTSARLSKRACACGRTDAGSEVDEVDEVGAPRANVKAPRPPGRRRRSGSRRHVSPVQPACAVAETDACAQLPDYATVVVL